jgi:hypothetical protein
MPTKLRVRFPGRCQCGHDVPAGTEITYDKSFGARERIRACPQCDVGNIGEDGPLNPDELPDSGPPPQLDIRIKVDRIKSSGDDGWAAIRARFDSEQETKDFPIDKAMPFSISGRVGEIRVGDLLDVYGSWNNHPKYGWEFKAISAAKVVGGTLQALKSFLAKLPHVGPVTAAAIIQQCGGTRVAVIEAIQSDPERLTVVKGITIERAKEIQEAFNGAKDLRESAIYLAGLGLPEGLTAKILDEWGKSAKQTLSENPYNLMDLSGVGFQRADEIALGRLGIHAHDPRRAAAAVLHVLIEQEEGFDGGHTWTDLEELTGKPQPKPTHPELKL